MPAKTTARLRVRTGSKGRGGRGLAPIPRGVQLSTFRHECNIRVLRYPAAMRGQSLFLLLACGCSSGLSIPADRPVLSWSGSAASDATSSLLHGFAGPDVHSCARDPTRVYIGELFFYGISDVQVPWHWAPIVSGPFASR